MKLVDKTVQVNAPAALLYELLTDAEHLVRWMAATAEVDAQVGGTIRWTHVNGDACAGQFLELVPARRIVFTYGWERPAPSRSRPPGDASGSGPQSRPSGAAPGSGSSTRPSRSSMAPRDGTLGRYAGAVEEHDSSLAGTRPTVDSPTGSCSFPIS